MKNFKILLTIFLIFNGSLFSMDIKPEFKWYQKVLLFPILIPYFAGKDLFEYLTKTRTVTPLHRAATGKNNEVIILKLLKEGADINARDHSGMTPLVYALRNQRFELAKLLLENGADVTIQDDIKTTAMSYIGQVKDLEIIKMMIKKGGNIHEQNYITEETVLHHICASGNINILEYTLSVGAKTDLNKVDYRGETPLHRGIRSFSKEKLKVAKILVSNGADLRIKNRDGKTALQLAETLASDQANEDTQLKELVQFLRR